MRSRRLFLTAALLLAAPLGASAQPTPGATDTALNADQRARLVQTLVANPRIRAVVGDRPRAIVSEPVLDKNETERYVRIESAPEPTRRVPVIFFNPQTNRAVNVLATLDGRIESVQPIPAVLVPFTAEDASDALDVVRRSLPNRIPGLERFRIYTGHEPRETYVVQLLPMHGGVRTDPCSVDRCADLIFRTPDGYLPLRAQVDLTKRTAQIVGGRR